MMTDENYDDYFDLVDNYIQQEKKEFVRKELRKSLRSILGQVFDQKAVDLDQSGTVSFARLPVKEHTLDLLMEKYGSFIETLGEDG